MKHDTKKLETLTIPYDMEDTTTFGDYAIKIRRDNDVESPREWDNLGTMVCWHNRYTLGDGNHGFETPRVFMHVISGLYSEEATEYLTDEQYDRCVTEAERINIILPLYLYDHSGITMSTSSFSCQWDSGQVGYIYVSREQACKEYTWKVLSSKRREQIETYLTCEVETYDQFLTGDVYGFMIERTDPDGDETDVDSCWGFYGYEDKYMIAEIKAAIRSDIDSIPQQESLI